MGRKKQQSGLESIQTAKTVIAAQPATAMTAFLDFALWGACVSAALEFIKISDARKAWINAHPIQASYSAILLGGLGPILGGFLNFSPAAGQIPQEVTTEDYKWALILGTLGYGTLKYAGAAIAEGAFGAVGNAAKLVGMPV